MVKNKQKKHYEKNKECLQEQVRNKYREPSNEEKDVKTECGKIDVWIYLNKIKEEYLEEYQNKYQKLEEYQKYYDEVSKTSS